MRYPVSQPELGARERRRLLRAFDAGTISSIGPEVGEFEEAFARAVGARYAIAVSSGTAALHLALAARGVKPGDEVVVPALTFAAAANAVRMVGARVVLADVDPDSWTLDPQEVERVLTPRTRAILVVHLYGVPADLAALGRIARRRRLVLIEDGAEALGSRWQGRHVGSVGDAGCFSLYGNKTITTGEGGVLLTRSSALARRARMLRDHGMSPTKRYDHPLAGFNYRMTALQAAVGLGQLERFDSLIARRKKVGAWYTAALGGVEGLNAPVAPVGCEVTPWLHTVAFRGWSRAGRDAAIARLARSGIDTRPVFTPLNALAPYRAPGFPVARRIAQRGISLPTYPALKKRDVESIALALRRQLKRPR